MTMTLKWRLGKLPTSNEVLDLLNSKLITKEEAREILFNQIEEKTCPKDGTKWTGDIDQCPTCQDQRDTKSLESEIKFLRELVEKLSSNPTRIIETIREIKVPYGQYSWYRPYEVWCSSGTSSLVTTGTGAMYLSSTASTDSQLASVSYNTAGDITNFSAISTF